MKSTIAFFLVLAAIYAVPRTAVALTTAPSPYASAKIYVGATSSGNTYVVFCNLAAAGVGALQQIGGPSGLFDNVQVLGGSGHDNIQVLNGSTSDSCAAGLSQGPIYGTHYLDVYGGGGDDSIDVEPPSGDTYSFGGAGNDVVWNFSSIGNIFGDAGDDELHLFSGATTKADGAQGGDGNDCLQDFSGTALIFDCGAGTADKYVGSLPATTFGATGCEIQKTLSCAF
jgi:hypothetical protein